MKFLWPVSDCLPARLSAFQSLGLPVKCLKIGSNLKNYGKDQNYNF